MLLGLCRISTQVLLGVGVPEHGVSGGFDNLASSLNVLLQHSEIIQVFGEERKGKERKGKERKGKERKGKERKGKERKGLSASIDEKASMIPGCPGAALHY